ncbi:uncharacterized protein C10orf95 [Sorex araneus]|uniref:uncharacterized protein C10orf95 n=1 Tax=Sorex araneus TaxID=42254 RepID=UPI0024334FB5|nr:uncharacterized protein C10orf95 [Sorex araneus]
MVMPPSLTRALPTPARTRGRGKSGGAGRRRGSASRAHTPLAARTPAFHTRAHSRPRAAAVPRLLQRRPPQPLPRPPPRSPGPRRPGLPRGTSPPRPPPEARAGLADTSGREHLAESADTCQGLPKRWTSVWLAFINHARLCLS